MCLPGSIYATGEAYARLHWAYELPRSDQSARRQKHAERRFPWNSGPTLRRSGLAPRDRYGYGVAYRCRACANEEISIARLVPVRSRAPKPCRYPCGDGSLISRSRRSEDTGQTWPSILRTGDDTRGTRKRCRNRRTIHFTRGWHEPTATEIPHDRIQAMDAHRPRALVARGPVGIGNIRPLVHPTPISFMNPRSCWRGLRVFQALTDLAAFRKSSEFKQSRQNLSDVLLASLFATREILALRSRAPFYDHHTE